MTPSHELRPAADLPFVHGPSVADGPSLLHWLAAQQADGRSAVVQLPVEAPRPGSSTHRVFVAPPAVDQERPLELRLDDTALGIALADRWATLPRPSVGAAWLEGTWDAAGTPPTLRVTRWLRPIVPSELAAAGFARRTVPAETAPALVAALAQLGEDVPMATKEDACRHLVAAGLAAAPLLVLSLDDGRTFARRDAVNRTNLPVTEQPEPVFVTRTVGTRCDELLHRIATPAPRQTFAHRGKVRSTQVLAIRDWRAFWQRRAGQTLAAIHAELEPLVDAYWAQQGTTQQVD